MANSDVFIDDIKLQDIGVIVRLSSQEPILPNLRTNTIAIPGRHGAYDFGAFFDTREFALDCVFKRQDYATLKTQIREFVSLFVDEYGRPKSVSLRFGDEPDKYYDVKVSAGIPIERIAAMGTFTLPLVAHDPFAYADITYKVPEAVTGINYDEGHVYPADPNEIYLSSEIYTFNDEMPLNEPHEPNYYYDNPASFQWNYLRHYSGVHNHSFYDTPLIVEIEGSVINPRIINQTTGKTLYLPTIQGAKMKIDTGRFSVKVNDKTELVSVKGIEDFALVSGDNSLVFEGGLPDATVTFKWKHKFM